MNILASVSLSWYQLVSLEWENSVVLFEPGARVSCEYYREHVLWWGLLPNFKFKRHVVVITRHCSRMELHFTQPGIRSTYFYRRLLPDLNQVDYAIIMRCTEIYPSWAAEVDINLGMKNSVAALCCQKQKAWRANASEKSLRSRGTCWTCFLIS